MWMYDVINFWQPQPTPTWWYEPWQSMLLCTTPILFLIVCDLISRRKK